MEEVLVSVIIPTYNRKSVLMRSISSILNQSHKNLEVIVVDDGSTDNTEDLFNNNQDVRIKYFQRSNSGANAARNYGITQSSGSIIAFNDSDDEWLPEKLSEQLSYLHENDFDAVFCQMAMRRKSSPYVFPKEICKEYELKDAIFQMNYIGTPALILKKSILESINAFDERMPRLQDWDFAIRLCNSFDVGFIKKPLLNIYLGEGSITQNNQLLETSLNILQEKYDEQIIRLPTKLRERVYLKFARFYLKAHSFKQANNLLSKVSLFNREKILTMVYYMLIKVKVKFKVF